MIEPEAVAWMIGGELIQRGDLHVAWANIYNADAYRVHLAWMDGTVLWQVWVDGSMAEDVAVQAMERLGV